jgi:hypothetical protein
MGRYVVEGVVDDDYELPGCFYVGSCGGTTAGSLCSFWDAMVLVFKPTKGYNVSNQGQVLVKMIGLSIHQSGFCLVSSTINYD